MIISNRIIFTYLLFVFIIFTIEKSQASPNKIKVWPEMVSTIEIYEDSVDLPFDSIINLDTKLFNDYNGQQFKKNNIYWLHITIDNSIANHKKYFIHFNSLLSNVKLYQKDENRNYIEKTEKTLIPEEKRLLGGLFKDKVPFSIIGKDKTVIYVKIITKQEQVFNLASIEIIAVKDYKRLTYSLDLIEFFFLGVSVILLLLNLTLFLLTRDKLYLYYFFYIFTTTLFFIYWNQLFERFVFYNYPWVDLTPLFFCVTISQAIYYWFLIEVLKNEDIPVWKKIIRKSGIAAILVCLVIITIAFFDFHLSDKINDIYSLMNGLFVITMFLFLFKKVSIKVKIILSGALIVVAGGMITIIANLFKFSTYHIFYYQFGVFVELILFTIAINYFYSKERLEKIKLNFANYKLETEKHKRIIENRDLVDKLALRNRELAEKTILIEQKETIIYDTVAYLAQLGDHNSEIAFDIQNKIKSLQLHRNNDNWKEFELHFRKINPRFYSRLIEGYPNLTRSDLKLCAFIKLNLSTKQIATITGRNLNTIDVSRSRLRKKMGLKNGNLTSFITSID